MSTPDSGPFEVLHLPDQGAYAARNLGAGEASGDILAFTDSDCIPDRDWLLHGVEEFLGAASRILVGGGVTVFLEHTDVPSAAELHDMLFAFPQERYVREYGFAVTANLFIPVDAFYQVGEFDSEVQSGGDLEWCRRAQSQGYELRYKEEASIWHPARRGWSELAQKTRRVTEGAFVLTRKAAIGAVEPDRWARPLRARLNNTLQEASRILGGKELVGTLERVKVLVVWMSLKVYRAWCRFRLRAGELSRGR